MRPTPLIIAKRTDDWEAKLPTQAYSYRSASIGLIREAFTAG